MSHWLFRNFLTDDAAYAKAQRHWERLFDRIVQMASASQSTWNYHWMNNPQQDGNPIFSAISPSLRRGVRIIQEMPPDADDIDLDWYVDSFGDRAEPEAISVLVIACCPSRENTGDIERLLLEWVRDGAIAKTHCDVLA